MSDNPPPIRPASGTATRPRIVPQAGPAAWRSEELGPADYMLPVGAEDVAEVEAVLAALGGRAPQVAAEAPLPRLGAPLRDAATRLETGRGFVLLRGFPIGRWDEGGATSLLQTLGVHLGRALPQGVGGGLIGHISGLPASGAADMRWRFHADPCDIVALLYLRHPPEVDPVVLVSAAAVHNEMMRRDRSALEELYRPMAHVGRGGVEGDRPVEMPVFSLASGAFVARYARDAIEAAQRMPETPRLSGRQVEALDLLDTICAEPGLALRIDVRPGDVLLFNPLLVWKRHAEAAAAQPGQDAGGTREALRLWLAAENSRALPDSLAAVQHGGGAGGGNSGSMVGG